MVKPRKNLTGHHFGSWTVLYQTDDYVDGKGVHSSNWMCQCSCSQHTIRAVVGKRLLNGTSTSCGCHMREINRQLHQKTCTFDLDSEQYGICYTNNGAQFIFDIEDYEKIKNICWYKNGLGYYCGILPNGQTVLLHRYIMGITQSDVIVDHRRGDLNDYRKSQLRVVTKHENNMNRALDRRNTSGCTGVTWVSNVNKWRATITTHRQTIQLGLYEKYEDAVQARKNAEDKYFGEYSYANSREGKNDDYR